MCNVSGIIFLAVNLKAEDVKGKKVIELGSRDVNGSIRPLVNSLNPKTFIGVDIEDGPNVDVICSAEEIFSCFERECFDVVLSTEMLEHVLDWKKVISNIKNLCKPGGTILITTRSYGFIYHPTPGDFWRFEKEDIEKIFSDCEIIKLEDDYISPGVFIKVRKPENFTENDLSDYKVYSIITNERTSKLTQNSYRNLHFTKINAIEKLRIIRINIGRFF